MASWLKADGTIEEVQPANGRDFKLAELKRFVDSGAPDNYIEIVACHAEGYEDLILVINENGKLYDLPVNRRATEVFGYTPPTREQVEQLKAAGVVMIGFDEPEPGEDGDHPLNHPEWIVGDVLLCKSAEVD